MEEPNKPSSWEQLELLYYKGLEADQATRAQLLETCGDPTLAREAAELWGHRLSGGDLFERLPGIARSFWNDFQKEGPPTHIAGYQVLEALGEGGMGEVYKAREGAPLERLLAVKILPAGLMTPSWIARFELEQKTLSLLNHAHIATIYDAGITEHNRPYLVMELLEGLPIHTYCDVHRLDLNQRLELFVQVCRGVAHAHRKGVIHRDIKPSNVLIVEEDGKPLARLIDFGISETTHGGTPSGRILGTPAYMSPEQAAGQEAEVDIRSDIYALGALLYQLLLGKSPLEEELRAVKTFDKRCDLVRELRPKPLSRRGGGLVTAETAAARATTPKRLKRALSGDLNWITAKAMAYNGEDRYDSCNALVADVTRYRANQVVSAVPHRGWYPIGKWLANHRLLMTSLSTLISSLVLALVVSVTALRTVSASERQLQDTQDFSEDIFRLVTPYQHGLQEQAISLLDAKATTLDETHSDRPDEEAALRLVLARFYNYLGLYEKAEPQYQRGCLLKQQHQAKDPTTLAAIGDRAYNLLLADKGEQARQLLAEARTEAIERHGPNHPVSLRLSNAYAYTLRRLNKLTEALQLFEPTLAAQQRILGKTAPESLSTASNLSELLVAMGRNDQAISLLSEILNDDQQTIRAPTDYTANLMDNLMLAYMGQGRYDLAAPLGEQALEIRTRMLGPLHRATFNSLNNLATTYGKAGEPQWAVTLLDTGLAKIPEGLQQTSDYLRLRHNLGHFLKETKDFKRAESVLTATWTSRTNLLGEGHLDTLKTKATLGELKVAMGDPATGLAILQEVVDLAEKHLEEGHPYRAAFKSLLEENADRRPE